MRKNHFFERNRVAAVRSHRGPQSDRSMDIHLWLHIIRQHADQTVTLLRTQNEINKY